MKMKNQNPEKRLTLSITAIWSIISLIGGINFIKKYYDVGMSNQYCSQVSKSEQIIWAVIAFVFAAFLIYLFSSFIIKAIMYNEKARKIVFFSLPFLIILASYLLTNLAPTHMNDYYVGDEKNIWDAAVRLYPYFFVYTSEIFLICFFIIPTIISPSIIKILFCSLVLGYTVYRINKYYDTKLSYLIYALCLLKPVCELGIQVHRMQWYAFLYLFFAIKLFFDSKEKKIKFSYTTVILMSCVISILTVLRREGLYLFVLGAFLMVLVYAKDNQVICKKNVIRVLIIFCICEAVIYYPAAKNGFGEKHTTYRAYLVHILGERSLDRSIISEELKIVDQYMNIEIIDRYNNDQGIGAFSDCMYDWQGWSDGYYYAIRDEEAVVCDEFVDAVFDIIKKEPVVFLKSRARAFAAAARGGNGYNLFLPLLITLFLTVYSLTQRDKTLMVLCLGVLAHTGITILTMPASYFKYFYEMYLFAYVFIAILVIGILGENLLDSIER